MSCYIIVLLSLLLLFLFAVVFVCCVVVVAVVVVFVVVFVVYCLVCGISVNMICPPSPCFATILTTGASVNSKAVGASSNAKIYSMKKEKKRKKELDREDREIENIIVFNCYITNLLPSSYLLLCW